ncbi:Uncharacterised protein [Klebsiella pneumoniae]|uniref:Uncharacterized protein n=1 Tax=Klebsiella pneumoniae TaxID=573 RepID=A0A2X3FK42_KLEPN|nr:Uncharacterised protein [Klebsiella pneumoniae]
MNKIVPRKIIKMTITASQEKTGWNCISIPCRLIALRTPAVFMNKASSFRPKSIFFYFEKPGIVR